MQRLIWTSDIHFDRMDDTERLEFKEHLLETNPDGFVIAGDIGEAASVTKFIKDFRNTLSCPIYFVLGNHDFWGSSFDSVKFAVRELVAEHSDLYWLTENDVIELDAKTALIGHDGWADARLGKIGLTGTVPRDFVKIKDLSQLPRSQYESALNQLGDAAAERIKSVLTKTCIEYTNIYLATHVPPFREAALGRSRRICDDQKLPFYSCKIVGDVLIEIMKSNPQCKLTVLCGHTHEKCEVDVLPNLRVKVQDAGYGTWYPPETLKF